MFLFRAIIPESFLQLLVASASSVRPSRRRTRHATMSLPTSASQYFFAIISAFDKINLIPLENQSEMFFLQFEFAFRFFACFPSQTLT